MNNIVLAGMPSNLEYSHKFYGEKFYNFFIDVERNSGVHDVLPCFVSEVFANFEAGTKIKVIGEMRTRNIYKDGKNHLDVYVHINETVPYDGYDENIVEIDGHICKIPTYREAPCGRWISDILCASNRAYGKASYIPCIAWGRNALRASKLDVGTKISANGRLQSREYEKQLDGENVVKTAYELSIATFSVEDDDD